ncbi:RluA family pseudouridine synthase [Bacillus idriensis]|uniref:Pseudouridine synthase n=1 Tax=Metabacillus idriensis TaxID=324768 RepID=A0A6I2M6G5_9BACI|nr:RluA family pseudouridine synthase [Metabacillus idriensis]MRX52426.1 RluA family pseudouridine synthase [Metabacillus idriensis]
MKIRGEWMEFPVKKDWAGISLQQMLREKMKAPKTLVHKWRMDREVKVNDADPNWTSPLIEKDSVMIRLFQDEEFDITPEYMELDLLFEDEHFLIINKPAGMDTHPNDPGQTGTLANGIAFHFQMQGMSRKIRHIHRLDHDTSGAIVFAKHALSHAILDRLLEERLIKRTYTAIVQGKMKQKKGQIDQPIGKDRHHPVRRRVSPGGQPALTHFKTEDYNTRFDVSLVKLQLDTGRTHQIRVHLSHIGYPISGDDLYGGNKNLIDRQALHASEITVMHPFTDEKVTVSADFPDDMKRLIIKLEF